MEQKKLMRVVGILLVIGGFIDKTIAFATASTQEQVAQRAASVGSAEFLFLFGIVMLIASFFVKKK